MWPCLDLLLLLADLLKLYVKVTLGFKILSVTKPLNDVGEMLSQVHNEEKQCNGQILMNIMQKIKLLGSQGIALRGP